MTYALTTSSLSGNTIKVATALETALPSHEVVFAGRTPDVAHLDEAGEQALAQIQGADIVVAGFWCDKGGCDAKTAALLATLEGKSVFLFGTAGAPDDDYHARVIEKAAANLPESAVLLGGFVCQGQLGEHVVKKFTRGLAADPNDAHSLRLKRNYETSQGHPNADDLARAVEAMRAALGL